MRLEKKDWISPRTGFQEFVPNEYCAPCGDGATEVTYYFMCDGGFGTTPYDAWLDNNPKNGSLDGNWVWNTGRYQWSSNGDSWLTYYKNRRVWHFESCNEKHTVTVPAGQSVDNIFPYGFIQQKNPSLDGYNTGPVISVRLWRGNSGNEIHATRQLNSESFTPHNPS